MRLWQSTLLIVILHLWALSADCIVRKSYCPEPPADQCSPCQNPSTVVYRETLNSQNSLAKEQPWRPHTSWLQNLGQTCSNPKSVVPASRWTRGAADGELAETDVWGGAERAWSAPCRQHRVISLTGQTIQWQERVSFHHKCWENWTSTHRRVSLGRFLTVYSQVNPRGSKTYIQELKL